MTCPSCNRDQVELFSDTETFEYKGQNLEVQDIEFSRCETCRFEFLTPQQAKALDRRVNDAQREHDGLLTGREIRDIRDQLNITQQQAAEILGGGTNSFAKYETGEIKQSTAMDNLLWVVKNYPSTFTGLCLKAGINTAIEIEKQNFVSSEYHITETDAGITASDRIVEISTGAEQREVS